MSIKEISFLKVGSIMGSEVKASRAGAAIAVSVGERVTLGDSDAEYVVVNVDAAAGRLELLRLKPGRIESGVPMSDVRRTGKAGPRLVSNAGE